MTSEPTVYVVDDDPGARESVRLLVRSMGVQSKQFESAEEFLASLDVEAAGCVVTDLRMPGASGLDLQAALAEAGSTLPVIVISGVAETRATVKAMEQGAITLLDKPYREDELWTAIRRALTLDVARRREADEHAAVRERFARLTARETETLRMILEGKPNKAAATVLNVSERTIENRRRSIFAKTGTKSVAELVRLCIEADVEL